jgi:hypothetical protein
MRIILHAGFHKTGTSSLQAILARHRAALLPHARLVLHDEMADVLKRATRFAVGGDPFDLAGFNAAFVALCERLAAEGHQTLILSCEGLSGRTPGKKGINDYSAALPLAQAMSACVKAVFGAKAEQHFLYTTRDAESWLYSAWRHNLAGYRVTEDFDSFRSTCAKAADFPALIANLTTALPRATLTSVALEEIQAEPAGPAEAVLRLLDLPAGLRASIRDIGVRNAGRSADLSAELLALNRSTLPDTEVKARKAALLRRP